MTVSKRILGNYLHTRLMKATIYGQFVAGETDRDLQDRVVQLLENGIGPMLCVPIEEDAGESMSKEGKYNKNFEMIMGCIRLSKTVDKRFPVSQIKLTAVVPGDICAQLSRLYPDPHTNIDILEQIVKALEGADVKFAKADKETEKNLSASLVRLTTIGKTAEELGVRLLIDAEYTYLNPALRLLTLAMMIRFNRQKPIVAYTYQNYLKETYGYLIKDCSLVRAYGATFAVKLVRGAYMTSERRLAVEGGYEDPVHATFEETTDMYNKSMEHMLDRIKEEPGKFYMVVASHNENTAKHAIQKMKEKAVESADGSVVFGQLYGMSDYLSSALSQSGYVVYKSTPYGPLEETIPYLHRRAVENSSVLSGTQKERQLLWRAFIDRLTFSRLPRKHI